MRPFWLLIAAAAVLSLLCSPSLAQSDPAPVLGETLPTSNHAVELPIQLYRDYLVVVEGKIGNLEKLSFLIDTGAYPSVVDQRIATALGLKRTAGKMDLANKTVQTELATLPFIEVGPARAGGLPIFVQDLSSIEKRLGRRIDAVVGLDVLGKNSFSIDYKTKQLRFGPAKRTKSTVSFEAGTPFVIVEVRLHNRPVRLLVDTAASALMLFQSRVKDPLFLPAGRTSKATNLDGDFQRRSVQIPDTRLGKQEFGPLTGFVVADHGDNGRDFDGLLSVRGLRLEEIGFDFENHEISWKK
jgi:predicted aspartyl protease